ncbi:MAG: radical SAM protein [Oscillospiraceae bacterium]|nr:radical SAM protein [Oscillospiraceae bacterium]
MIQRKQTEPYLARYLHSKGAKLGLPIGGNFELTARCNFDCPMCYVHLKQEDIEAQGRELTAQQWIDIARQARDAGMVFALLTGGEPFVRKDFFEIYHAMKELGLLISINSNGSMLSGPILEKLLEDPPFRINISLYGGSNETYCGMCGQPAFDRVVENIAALKKAGIDVRLNVSITPYNRHDLEAICKKAEELGVHVKLASYMYPSIRVNGGKYGYGDRLDPEAAAAANVQWDLLRFTPEEFARRACAVHEYALVEGSECAADLDEGVGCRAGSTAFWMTWDGRMLPCGMMPYPTAYPLETGFRAAWEQIREETRKLRMPAKCGSCPKRGACAVCAAVCVTETGKFDGVPEYMCAMTDAVIRETWNAYKERSNED